MNDVAIYDVTIIGGGLAGLATAIQLKKMGFNVLLFEKEKYPFHKVCGEYISMESWDFIKGLGLNLSTLNLPLINTLFVSAPNGNLLQQNLPLGGFGISRFFLDNELKNIAVVLGVIVKENCKVDDVIFEKEQFNIYAQGGQFKSKICCGSFGKRSNLDVKWKRPFIQEKGSGLNNYIGVKYHIKTNAADNVIALHNFENGYCGMSKIENETYCLCYLTTANNLKKENNSITQMEQNILQQNKHLKEIFANSEIIYKTPLTISQISFSKKKQVQQHILLLGDAAGMITPLCGNGMSMALHSSKIASAIIQQFLKGGISRQAMETAYTVAWRNQFGQRIFIGRLIQRFFGKAAVTNFFVTTMKRLPSFTRWLIKQTHGKPF